MSGSGQGSVLSQQLIDGLILQGESPEYHPVDAYLAYLELLQQWNKAYSLTAIRQPAAMVAYHILDSLSVLPYLDGKVCLDVGSGAGLPGLILALARPDSYWTLLDSNGKKIRFINQVIMELGLKNVEAVSCRIEDFHTETPYSTVTARAWGPLYNLYQVTRHLIHSSGHLLAMKGPDVTDELVELEHCAVTAKVHSLVVPGVESLRTLVDIVVLPSRN